MVKADREAAALLMNRNGVVQASCSLTTTSSAGSKTTKCSRQNHNHQQLRQNISTRRRTIKAAAPNPSSAGLSSRSRETTRMTLARQVNMLPTGNTRTIIAVQVLPW